MNTDYDKGYVDGFVYALRFVVQQLDRVQIDGPLTKPSINSVINAKSEDDTVTDKTGDNSICTCGHIESMHSDVGCWYKDSDEERCDCKKFTPSTDSDKPTFLETDIEELFDFIRDKKMSKEFGEWKMRRDVPLKKGCGKLRAFSRPSWGAVNCGEGDYLCDECRASTDIERLRKNPEFLKHKKEYEDMAEEFTPSTKECNCGGLIGKDWSHEKWCNLSTKNEQEKKPHADVVVERAGNITKHGIEAIRAVAGTDEEYSAYVKKYSTNSVQDNSHSETPSGNIRNVGVADTKGDIHSQLKDEMQKDYSKGKKEVTE